MYVSILNIIFLVTGWYGDSEYGYTFFKESIRVHSWRLVDTFHHFPFLGSMRVISDAWLVVDARFILCIDILWTSRPCYIIDICFRRLPALLKPLNVNITGTIDNFTVCGCVCSSDRWLEHQIMWLTQDCYGDCKKSLPWCWW